MPHDWRSVDDMTELRASQLCDLAVVASWIGSEANVLSENASVRGLYESLGFDPATRPPEESESPSVYMELECRALSATEAPECSADDR